LDKEYTITIVHGSMVEYLWEQIEPMVDKVTEKAPEDIVASKVKEKLLSGEDVLMTIMDGMTVVGAVTLTVRTLDSGTKALYMPFVCGTDLENWIAQGFKIVIAVAKQYGCTELRGVSARKGWMRYMQDYGWEEVFTTVRRRIGED